MSEKKERKTIQISISSFPLGVHLHLVGWLAVVIAITKYSFLRRIRERRVIFDGNRMWCYIVDSLHNWCCALREQFRTVKNTLLC